MPKNNYFCNSESEIIKLKSELMTSENNSVVSFSSEYYKNRNSEIGKIFEENIKNTLKFEFGWEKGDVGQHFYYRIVKLNGNEYILMRDGKLALTINGKKYFLLSNSDIITLKRGKKILKKYDNKNITKITPIISRKKLVFQKETEIETDGYFHIQNFDFSRFNDDFSILYNNIEDEELEEASNILIEIKLNKRKIPEMIKQLKRDKNIYEKMTKEKILYMGIVGYSGRKKNIDINYEEELDGFKCVIIEMKNDNFCGRNMEQHLDWKLIREVKKNTTDIKQMKEDINNLKEDMNGLKDSVTKLESSVAVLQDSVAKLESSLDEIKKDIKEIKSYLSSHLKNDKKMLGQKRARIRKESN